MDLPAYPSLSTAANEAIAQGVDLPAPFQSFRFRIEPGQSAHFDGLGNRAYVATATGEIEISTNGGVNYELWDTAMELDFGRDHFFRRVYLRNPGGDVVTGILYTGFAGIGDHRMHQVGETRLTLENQAGTGFENTTLLNDASWKTIAPSVTGKREVWIAAERADGAAGPVPVAYWRANSTENARVPSHEIGLALDGITRLPFSDKVEVCTNADPGTVRIRYWLVSFMDAGSDSQFGSPPPEETLLIPQMADASDTQGLVLSANSNEGDIWKLFDRDAATEYVCGNIGQKWFSLVIDLGELRNISRLALKWNSNDVKDADYAPHYIRFHHSANNSAWGTPIADNTAGLCTKPVALGQIIYSRPFADGEVMARWVKLEVLRPWNRGAGASYFRLAGMELYTKDPL
ncbi:discoidin domain-containing protein [Termitidicoccus mucosus]|uniref:F5/8 type C domain-containing protein n=1 Tax=Termitidicoccus mucosus TaxID=1184151 RepID=A0A178IJD5_9BACT|nr:hypothetical protein AW736_11145 [Opitutaceae bacterium TSB47]